MDIGQTIGNYRIVEKLGEGGIGEVFGGYHVQLSRRAAIKVLRPEFSADPDMVSRFFNEAEAVNVVQHPGIVSIFEFGRLEDQTAYIVMEFLEGETLTRRMRRAGRLGLPGLRLVRQIASALAAVHARGIVHRDLKPDNVMIVADPDVQGGERCKLLDFGIAKITARPGPTGVNLHATRAGQMMGTPYFMSPEQFRDAAAVTDRADVYSLGVMLYEILAGQPPFVAQGLADLAGMHLYVAPRPLSEVDPTLPPGLSDLVSRMLAKGAEGRPAMSEVVQLLGGFVDQTNQPAGTAPGAPLAEAPSSHSTRSAPTGGVSSSTAMLARADTASGAPVTAPGAAAGQTTAPPRRPLLPAILGVGVLCVAGVGLILNARRHPAPVAVPAPAVPTPPEVPAPRPPAPAAIDLGALRSEALLVVREGLRESDAGLRRRAVAALLRGRDAQKGALLVPVLRDTDTDVQSQAVLALQRLGDRDPADTAALVELLSDRATPEEVRVQAAAALFALGDDRGDKILRAALRSRDARARLRAAQALAERGDRKAQRLLFEAPELEEETAQVLGRLHRRGEAAAAEALRRFLPPARPVDEVSVRAAEELARGEDVPARALLEELARADGPLRLRAARSLSALDEPMFYELLLSSFRDSAMAVGERVLSAEGLGFCGRKDGAPPLRGVLPRESGAAGRLRLAAAGSILQIAALDPRLMSEDSLAVVALNLKDAGVTPRARAAAALGEAEPAVGVPLLQRAIRDEEPEVRRGAAAALGRTRARAAVPVLGEALSDRVDGVRREALASVGKVGQHLRQRGEAVDDMVQLVNQRAAGVSATAGERVARAQTLLKLGDDNQRTELQAALRDPDPGVRLAAAGALAERRDASGVPVLEQALRRPGAEALVARGHLLRLGRTVPEALPPLKGTEGERVAMVSACALLPAAEALLYLRQAAQDLASAVRLEAIAVLAELPALLAEAAGRRLLGLLLQDSDPVVRSRAGLLAARLKLFGDKPAAAAPVAAVPPPDLGAPAAPDLGVAAAPQRGHLIIEAEPEVRFQLDRRAPQVGPQPAQGLSSGRHRVSYFGGSVEVEVPPGETVTVRVPLTQGEQALHDAEEAFAAGDTARAQERLSRARALLGRGGGGKDRWYGLLFTQARLHESGARWLEAMTELEQLDRKLPAGSRSAAQRAEIKAVFDRVAAHLGRVRVSKDVDGTCQRTEIWALPGVHVLDVGGESREVRVKAGEIAEVQTCH